MAGQSEQRVSGRHNTEHRKCLCESVTKFRCVNRSGWRDRAKCLVTANRDRQTDRRGQLASTLPLIYEHPLRVCTSFASLQTSQLHNLFGYVRSCKFRIKPSHEQMTTHLCVSISETFTNFFFRLIRLRLQMLPVVLYGCETWSIKLREKHTSMLRLLKDRVMMRTFGPRDEVKGEW
jgi:hypothetical protein